MKSVYVVHYHEIALKGQNRPNFLRKLQENICAKTGLRKNAVKVVSGRLIVDPSPQPAPRLPCLLAGNGGQAAGRGGSCGNPSTLMGEVRVALSHVFGISSFSPAILVDAEYREIEEALNFVISGGRASDSTEDRPLHFETFAIAATRGDKKFPMTSKDLEVKFGDFVREKFRKKVDLENPEVTFYVEVFPARGGSPVGGPGGAVVYTEKIPGPGGLPVGIAAKVAVLLSGGIDSPVAAYRIMKRGAPMLAVHFHSYPFASRASIDKVKEVTRVLQQYSGEQPIALYTVPLAEAQKQVVQKCNERYRVLLYRRLMWRIAAEIAEREGARALVTGESLGQVASQTIENMAAVEAVIRMPIFRPLIGFDKQEIINEAQRIGTYEISIQPHEDCCTLFMPRRVATRARIEDLDAEEKKLSIADMISAAMEKMEKIEHLAF